MKKIICLSVVLLLLVGVTCAMAADKKTPLTKANQATLKGKWAGTCNFGSGQSAGMTLEITNDAPPYAGTIEFVNVPAAVAQYLGNFSNATTVTGPFDTGMITTKGTLIITGKGGNFGEFDLMGTSKLNGWFFLWGGRGDATLTKK